MSPSSEAHKLSGATGILAKKKLPVSELRKALAKTSVKRDVFADPPKTSSEKMYDYIARDPNGKRRVQEKAKEMISDFGLHAPNVNLEIPMGGIPFFANVANNNNEINSILNNANAANANPEIPEEALEDLQEEEIEDEQDDIEDEEEQEAMNQNQPQIAGEDNDVSSIPAAAVAAADNVEANENDGVDSPKSLDSTNQNTSPEGGEQKQSVTPPHEISDDEGESDDENQDKEDSKENSDEDWQKKNEDAVRKQYGNKKEPEENEDPEQDEDGDEDPNRPPTQRPTGNASRGDDAYWEQMNQALADEENQGENEQGESEGPNEMGDSSNPFVSSRSAEKEGGDGKENEDAAENPNETPQNGKDPNEDWQKKNEDAVRDRYANKEPEDDENPEPEDDEEYDPENPKQRHDGFASFGDDSYWNQMNQALADEEEQKKEQQNNPNQGQQEDQVEQDKKKQKGQAELSAETPQERKNRSRKRLKLNKTKDLKKEAEPLRSKKAAIHTTKFLLGVATLVLILLYALVCLVTLGLALLFFVEFMAIMNYVRIAYTKIKKIEEKINDKLEPIEEKEEKEKEDIADIDKDQAKIQKRRRAAQERAQQQSKQDNVRQLRPQQSQNNGQNHRKAA